MAPQARLELATLRLQCFRYFHNGPDYLFALALPSEGRGSRQGVGRLLRLIGENPHPLVSARSPLRRFSSRGFAQDCHTAFDRCAGSPEFTRFFNPGLPGKLQPLQPDALPLSYCGISTNDIQYRKKRPNCQRSESLHNPAVLSILDVRMNPFSLKPCY
jgi:hypothetical protein